MNKKQLALFYKNTMTLTKAVQLCGGCVQGVLKDRQSFIETLSRNGIELAAILHPNMEY